jgi:tetratricopeptide (TPR) repeat protein
MGARILYFALLMSLTGFGGLILPAAVGQRVDRKAPAPTPAASPDGRSILRFEGESDPESIAALQDLLRRNPEIARLAERVDSHPNDLQSLQALAEKYLAESLFLAAHDLYRRLSFRQPENPQASLGLARIWRAWGDTGQALEFAENALTLDPGSIDALELIAGIQLRRGQSDASLKAWLDSIALSPGRASSHAGAGFVYLFIKDWESAIRHLTRAVDLGDTSPETRNNLGLALARKGDREGALHQFTLAGDPAAAHNNLGVVYISDNNWILAREEFIKALALRPGYPLAQSNLQDAEQHLADKRDSAPAEPNPADSPDSTLKILTFSGVEASYEEGMKYLAVRKLAMARKSFQLALEKQPGSEIAASRLRGVELDMARTYYAVQVYSERRESDAVARRRALFVKTGLDPLIERADLGDKGTWYRVRFRLYETRNKAQQAAKKMKTDGVVREYWIVPPEIHAADRDENQP